MTTPKKMMSCQVCGVEIVRNSASQKYCKSCAREVEKARRHSYTYQRVCKGCGNTYESRRSDGVYCKYCYPWCRTDEDGPDEALEIHEAPAQETKKLRFSQSAETLARVARLMRGIPRPPVVEVRRGHRRTRHY